MGIVQGKVLQTSEEKRLPLVLWLSVFLIGLAIFLPTLNPSITWFNSGEMAAAAMTLDVPHPPGYPLFTRLANLAVHVPIGSEPAARVNALAAILGAAGAGFFALWLQMGGCSPWIGGAAAVWMMGFLTFWEEATNAEVYTLEILLLAGLLCVGWSSREGPLSAKKAFLLGLLLTLGIGNRPTFWIFSLALAAGLSNTRLFRRSNIKTVRGFSIGFIVGILPTVDLFSRLQNPGRVLMDPLAGLGFDGFWRVFTAADFHHALFVFGPEELLERGLGWLRFIAGDGGIAMLILPVLPFFLRLGRRDPVVMACLWIIMVNTGFVLNYNAFEAQSMLLPTAMGLCGLAGRGISMLSEKQPKWGVYPFLLLVGLSVYFSFLNLSPRNREAELFAHRLTAGVPRGSTLLLSNDVEFRPIWYLRLARNFRPDLNLRLIDALESEEILSLKQEVAKRPVFGTLIFPKNLRERLHEVFNLQPWGYSTRILPPSGLKVIASETLFPLHERSFPEFGKIGFFPGAVISMRTSVEKSAGVTWNGNEKPPLAGANRALEASSLRGHEFAEAREINEAERVRKFGRVREAGKIGKSGENGEDEKIGEMALKPAIAHGGDVFSYFYTVTDPGKDLAKNLIAAFLVRSDGPLISENGVLLGCDLHRPADVIAGCVEIPKAGEILKFDRTLIIPQCITPGNYMVKVVVVPPTFEAFNNSVIERLEGVTVFNVDGYGEVFRLRNGLGDRPFLRGSIEWLKVAESVSIAEIRIE